MINLMERKFMILIFILYLKPYLHGLYREGCGEGVRRRLSDESPELCRGDKGLRWPTLRVKLLHRILRQSVCVSGRRVCLALLCFLSNNVETLLNRATKRTYSYCPTVCSKIITRSVFHESYKQSTQQWFWNSMYFIWLVENLNMLIF